MKDERMRDLKTEEIRSLFAQKFDLEKDVALDMIVNVLVKISERMDMSDDLFDILLATLGVEIERLPEPPTQSITPGKEN